MVTEDAIATATLAKDDVTSGNMIDVISFRFNRKTVAYAAFPTGETGCQLSK